MRILLILALVWPLAAQAPAKPDAQTPAKAEVKLPAKAEAQPPDKPGAKPTEPAPAVVAAEEWFSGSINVGYRWRTDVAGSFNTYRSVVDLGSGPKLLDAEFTHTRSEETPVRPHRSARL
jgi:hypothetical protein